MSSASDDRPSPDLPDGAIPSPNIWHSPQVYEIENRAVDRAGVILGLIGSIAPWAGRDVLDIGCGTGLPPAGVRRDGAHGDRRRAARATWSRSRAGAPGGCPT